MVWLPHHDIAHLSKDVTLKVDIVLKKARELRANCFIFLPPSFHCKQLWHFQLQQVNHQVSSPAIITVTPRHRLDEVQEVVVVVCTTKPGCVLCRCRLGGSIATLGVVGYGGW